MIKKFLVLILVCLVIALPFILRKQAVRPDMISTDERLIIITAHNEAIRREFGEGFIEWYHAKTGRSLQVEWRIPGGTSEAIKYLDSMYLNAFKLYWERILGKRWTQEIQAAFSNNQIILNIDSSQDTPVQSVRRAFLHSNVTCGMDVVFGGGVYEINKQAQMGQLMALDLVQTPPKWFVNAKIARFLGGDELWDIQGRWIGSSLSSFGIVFNRDALAAIQFVGEPKCWHDLANPCFLGKLALVDPTLSSPTSKTFEIITQQHMSQRYDQLAVDPELDEQTRTQKAIHEGWLETLKTIQKMSGNARYFMESSAKAVLDVAAGSCAAAMSIDHYGRYQQESIRARSHTDRFGFVIPTGQVSVSPDTIAILKGAPNVEAAKAFVEYVISLKGQELLGLKAGSPDGPKEFTLRCMPITKEFYEHSDLEVYRSDPELNPYKAAEAYVYREEWTASVVGSLRFIIKAAFIDSHEELTRAWRGILKARAEDRHEAAHRALTLLEDFSIIDYVAASTTIAEALRDSNPLNELSLQSHLTRHFRQQYTQAYEALK